MKDITFEVEDLEKLAESIEYVIEAAIFGKEKSEEGYHHFRNVFSLVISLRKSIKNQNNNDENQECQTKIEVEDPEKITESIEYVIEAAIFGKEKSEGGYQHFRNVFSCVISLRKSIKNQNDNDRNRKCQNSQV